MGLLRFITGVLGILLIVGAFGSFLPLFLLGGIATGSVGFAFGLPIALMIIGAIMVYFGFYYHGSVSQSNTQLSGLIKWGLIHALAIWLASIGLEKLSITNSLLVILLTALAVSVIAQIVRSKYADFNARWFIFYYLIHATIFWIVVWFILPLVKLQGPIITPIAAGFVIAGVALILKKQNLRRETVPWVCIALVVILLIGQLASVKGIAASLPVTGSNSTAKLAGVDPACEARVRSIIGNGFEISYTVDTSTNRNAITNFNTRFLESKEQFDSNSNYGANQLQYSRTTTRKVIRQSVHPGASAGEKKGEIYGAIEYQYDYTLKDLTDQSGIILGDNHFTIRLKVDPIENYHKYKTATKSIFGGPGAVITIPLNIEKDTIIVTSCKFVDNQGTIL